MVQSAGWHGPLYALAAAALFGASTPMAKLLLGAIDPWSLAGLLYLGSGLGLLLVALVRRRFGAVTEAPLRAPICRGLPPSCSPAASSGPSS